VKMFDARKTRMIELPYGEKYDDMLSRFHTIPACHVQTDRQTEGRMDGRSDRIAISISRVSINVLTRDKIYLLRYGVKVRENGTCRPTGERRRTVHIFWWYHVTCDVVALRDRYSNRCL